MGYSRRVDSGGRQGAVGERDMGKIAFVTTANYHIGTGHLRRCITLAEAFERNRFTVGFFVYNAELKLEAWLRKPGRHVEMGADAPLERVLCAAGEWAGVVVVDTYDVQACMLESLNATGISVLVIDDLVNRALPATWVLNSAVEHGELVYGDLTKAMLLTGPQYAILRPQFTGLGPHPARPVGNRILVTVGGSDPLGQSDRIMQVLSKIEKPLEIRLVLGALSEDISSMPRQHNVTCLKDVSDMAGLMQWADLAVAGSGQTIFELAAAGCPAVCLQVADNQRLTGSLFSGKRSAVVLDARVVADDHIEATLRMLINDHEMRKQMSSAGQMVVDGRGTDRIVAAVLHDI